MQNASAKPSTLPLTFLDVLLLLLIGNYNSVSGLVTMLLDVPLEL
jgi:hypothetical protein